MNTGTLTDHFAGKGFDFLLGTGPAKPSRHAPAWQQMIGEKPIGAHLDLLPDRKTNWRALATSTFAQAGAVAVLFFLQIFMPPGLAKIEYQVIPLATPLLGPPPEKPAPPPARVKAEPLKIEQPPPRPAKLLAPRPLPPPVPKRVEARPVEVPKVEQAAVLPKMAVPDPVLAKPREVKTGGFGDPHGLPGVADPNTRVNIAHVGSFDSDAGATSASAASAKGNGSVALAGFGGVSVASGTSNGGPRAIEKSGFQSAEVVATAPAKPKPASQAGPTTTAVAILAKPSPVYTDEARRLGIEGEVLVNVVFLATGQVKVQGVEKGLGHGLDQAARQSGRAWAIRGTHLGGRPGIPHRALQRRLPASQQVHLLLSF